MLAQQKLEDLINASLPELGISDTKKRSKKSYHPNKGTVQINLLVGIEKPQRELVKLARTIADQSGWTVRLQPTFYSAGLEECIDKITPIVSTYEGIRRITLNGNFVSIYTKNSQYIRTKRDEIKNLLVQILPQCRISVIRRPSLTVTGKPLNYVEQETDSDSKIFKYGLKEAKPILPKISIVPNGAKEIRDFRSLKIFTIDSEESIYLDDALSLQILPNGNYLVGIHIADVTPLLKNVLTQEYSGRHDLSPKYGLKRIEFEFPRKMASLLPNEDRRAWSLFIWTEDSGEIKNFDVVRSLINSKQQFSYSDVNRILQNGNEFYELHVLDDIAQALRYNRLQNGYSAVKSRSKSHTIVEENMILANYFSARYLGSSGVPLIHRLNLPINFGNYNLRLDDYTYFTSPLRRRLDRITQLQLNALFDVNQPLGEDELATIVDHLNKRLK